MSRIPTLSVVLLVRLFVLLLPTISNKSMIILVDSALACDSDEYCSEMIRPGSICLSELKTCSNPFQSSCLATRLPNDSRFFPRRVCNSDDVLPTAVDDELCILSDFTYDEIRIHNGNWESSIFLSWIMQILLMEVVQVPVTIGLGPDTTKASSFYSVENTLAYSAAAYPFTALEEATRVGDCRLSDQDCAHIMPEVWNGQKHEWEAALKDNYIDPLEGNGQVGKGSWYVPAFTAHADDTLVSFYGLQGEVNRHKLANALRRPTTWLEYCTEVSTTNCSGLPENDDDETESVVAWRYPSTTEEQAMYYAGPDAYLGHFRLTNANNCTLNPTTCAGHIIGPPCSWSTNVDGQLYWNDITLLPDGPVLPNGGYEYGSMIQIWRAANATQSNVMFWWWRPDALVEEFVGTSSQFQQVLLPEATDTCSRSRVDTEARCSTDIMERRGVPEGACDQEAHALQKIFSKSLQERTNLVDRAIRSPGYDLLQNIKVTDLEVNNMIRRWLNRTVDRYGHDAREAVCDWMVDHLDQLLDFVPQGYPRILSHQSKYDTGFLTVTKVLGAITACVVVCAAGITYHYRKTRVFVYTQLYFCWLILMGFFLISIAAIVSGLEPSAVSCTTQAWFMTLGYTIELVPLLVKIAAINKILQSAKKMRRVQIKPRDMLQDVAIVVVAVVAYLLVWTCWDYPREHERLRLESEQSQVVFTSLQCQSSKFQYWYFCSLAWQALLLLMASVLAFQSRNVMQEFNESRSLGTMVYSHFLFVLLRSILFFLGKQSANSDESSTWLEPNIVAAITSLLLSLDTLFALVIYMLPKFLEAKKFPEDYDPNSRKNRPVMQSGSRVSLAMSNITLIESRAAAARKSFMAAQAAGTTSVDLPSESSLPVTSSLRTSSMKLTSGLRSWRSSGGEGDKVFLKDHSACSVVPELSNESGLDLSNRSLGGGPESSSNHSKTINNKTKSDRGVSFSQDEKSLDDPFAMSSDDDDDDDEEEDPVASKAEDILDSLTGGSSRPASVKRLQEDAAVQKTSLDSDDEEEEDFDVGGPRWSKPELNEELNRSVRSMVVDPSGNGKSSKKLGGSGIFSNLFAKGTPGASSTTTAKLSRAFNPVLPVMYDESPANSPIKKPHRQEKAETESTPITVSALPPPPLSAGEDQQSSPSPPNWSAKDEQPPMPEEETMSPSNIQEGEVGSPKGHQKRRAASPARERKRLIENEFAQRGSQGETSEASADMAKESYSTEPTSRSGSSSACGTSQEFVVPMNGNHD